MADSSLLPCDANGVVSPFRDAEGNAVAALVDADGKLETTGGSSNSTTGQKTMDESTSVVLASDHAAVATTDAGPNLGTLIPFHLHSDDLSTPLALMESVTAAKTVKFVDLVISVQTACYMTVQMETTNNVLASHYLPANGSAMITLRGCLTADAVAKKVYVKTDLASKGSAYGEYCEV